MDLDEFTSEMLKRLIDGTNSAAIEYAVAHGATVIQEDGIVPGPEGEPNAASEQIRKIQMQVAVNDREGNVITFTAYFTAGPKEPPGITQSHSA